MVMDEDRALGWHEVKNDDTVEIFNGTDTGGVFYPSVPFLLLFALRRIADSDGTTI